MSHFCLLVVTESRPTEEILIEALAPYHEFECTGENDQYVQDIDITEEALAEFERQKNDEDGEVVASNFIKDWYGYETVKEGRAIDVEGAHKFGYALANLKGVITAVYRRTNPNAQWDWWQVGGRFSEFLIAKPHVFSYTKDDSHLMPSIGEPGLMGSKSQNDGFDIIRKGDVDFEAMRAESRKRGLEIYDKVYEVVENLDDFIPWSKLRDEIIPGDIDRARDAYHDQRAKIAINEYNKNGGSMYFLNLEDFMCSREEYAKQCEDSAVVTFAVLNDGQWYERGKMGWWGVVSDETEKDVWNEEFRKMLDSVPDDHWLSIIDCHI